MKMIRAIEQATPADKDIDFEFVLSLSRDGLRQLNEELGDIHWTYKNPERLRLETGVFILVERPDQAEPFIISVDPGE